MTPERSRPPASIQITRVAAEHRDRASLVGEPAGVLGERVGGEPHDLERVGGVADEGRDQPPRPLAGEIRLRAVNQEHRGAARGLAQERLELLAVDDRQSALPRQTPCCVSAICAREPPALLETGTPMATYKLFLLPGDGIGPEVMAEAEKVIAFFNARGRRPLRDREGPGRRLRLSTPTAPRSARPTWRARKPPTRCCSAPSAGRNGRACPMRCARRRACCGCARTCSFTPICARRSAIPRSPTPRR